MTLAQGAAVLSLRMVSSMLTVVVIVRALSPTS